MEGEDLKTMDNDLGKSHEADSKKVDIGSTTVINGKLHKWDGDNWINQEIEDND